MSLAGKRGSACLVGLGPKQIVLGQSRTPKPGDQEMNSQARRSRNAPHFNNPKKKSRILQPKELNEMENVCCGG